MDQQSELFDLEEFKDGLPFGPDDWETPDDEAKAMADLTNKFDNRILEPSAGTGQITQYLPYTKNCYAVELDSARCNAGMESSPHCLWRRGNFLKTTIETFDIPDGFDLILGNPPFSVGIEFIAHSLKLLNDATTSRAVFLLPNGYLQAVERYEKLQKLTKGKFLITRTMPFINRIAFLKEGVSTSGAQQFHSLFEFRKPNGSNKANVIFIEAGSYKKSKRRRKQ